MSTRAVAVATVVLAVVAVGLVLLFGGSPIDPPRNLGVPSSPELVVTPPPE